MFSVGKRSLLLTWAFLAALSLADERPGQAAAIVSPELVAQGSRLTQQQVDQWRNEGYILLQGLLPQGTIESLRTEVSQIYTSPELQEPPPTAEEWDRLALHGSFGSSKTDFQFPSCKIPSLNHLVVDQGLVGAVEQLLNTTTDNLSVTQGELWVKHGPGQVLSNFPRLCNQDQRIHMDFPNHNMLIPTDSFATGALPDAVSMIVYLSNASEVGGRTALVSRSGIDDPAYHASDGKPVYRHNPGFGRLPWTNDREHTERFLQEHFPESFEFRKQLYEREARANFGVGSVLLYRHDLWHRGTPLTPRTTRFTVNLVYTKRGQNHIHNWGPGVTKQYYCDDWPVERLVASISPSQRTLLGFPSPSDKVWEDPEVLRQVRERYEFLGMDMEPYERAFHDSKPTDEIPISSCEEY